MEDTTHPVVTFDRRPAASRRRMWALTTAGASVTLVLASPLLDHEPVESPADQGDVALGLPLAWLHQDQGALDPPLPGQAGFASPWEHPSTVSPGLLILDVAIVAAALVTVLALVMLMIRRTTQR